MMETIDGGSQYVKMVHMNLNSALYGLVTPPRTKTSSSSKRMMSEVGFATPPPVAPSRPPDAILSRSLPKATRLSPSRLSPPCQDGGKGFYAGAKFGERPPPTELPKPPNHWVSRPPREQSCVEMTNTLKVLLKVQS